MTTELKNPPPGRRALFSGCPCYVLEHRPDGTLHQSLRLVEKTVSGEEVVP
jgi:hypothetical protein